MRSLPEGHSPGRARGEGRFRVERAPLGSISSDTRPSSESSWSLVWSKPSDRSTPIDGFGPRQRVSKDVVHLSAGDSALDQRLSGRGAETLPAEAGSELVTDLDGTFDRMPGEGTAAVDRVGVVASSLDDRVFGALAATEQQAS
jgi:hypothetical protein